MKIVFISDTHLKEPEIPEGDVLVHSGDATFRGDIEETSQFSNWFLGLPHKQKIFVPGNHDWLFQRDEEQARALMDDGGITHVLIDQEITLNLSDHDGEEVKFYGSPWQPEFCGWAFNLPRYDSSLLDKWEEIPDDTDVLVTHGPPQKILDENREGLACGCYDLARRVEKVKPKIHAFGHIHEGYGKREYKGTTYVNASVVNRAYDQVNDPIVLEV